jgi:hypothetical protein
MVGWSRAQDFELGGETGGLAVRSGSRRAFVDKVRYSLDDFYARALSFGLGPGSFRDRFNDYGALNVHRLLIWQQPYVHLSRVLSIQSCDR